MMFVGILGLGIALFILLMCVNTQPGIEHYLEQGQQEKAWKQKERQEKQRLAQIDDPMERIWTYLSTLPADSPGKTCTEIYNEVPLSVAQLTVPTLLWQMKERGCVDSRESKGKAYFFSSGEYVTEEEWQQREQERKNQEQERQAQEQQERTQQKHERQKLNREIAASGMDVVDKMDGHKFEHYCADLLRKLNFTNVEVTKGSGDQGVDIIAVKDGIRYAIQCKCYSSSLGNSPVQEVNAGKQLYGCHVAVVLTNQHFTSGAKTLASATGVLLWDREKLQEMIKQAGQSQN